MRRLAAILLVCLAAAPARAGTPPDLGARLTEGYIRPATLAFANAAAALSGDLDYLCRAPDRERLDAARARFGTLVDTWFRVFFLRFGPLVEDGRFERIYFWPDPRGVILRQVQDLLAARDPDAIDPDRLAAKSVAVQGLPALEFALFGSGAETILEPSEEGRYRCAYARAVSARLASTAGEVAAAWSPEGAFARDFAAPAPGNALYRSQQEVAAEAVKALAGGFQFLGDVMIAPFLGKEPEQANARRAPLWRSGMTLRAIRRGVEGLGDFYAASGFADSLPATDRWIDGALALEMRKVPEALAEIDMPLEEAVVAGRGREALVYAVIALKSLHTTVETRLAPAVGVGVGFNALDGD